MKIVKFIQNESNNIKILLGIFIKHKFKLLSGSFLKNKTEARRLFVNHWGIINFCVSTILTF